ncbi:MAG TPA: BTAD domain-containing putative transcriptional regulator, partial [Gemmatimonadaceae bacterium]|nr:BTAD domain-containing putative transcriptional regulator [Gemmatimonadaceae bacterium]
MNELLTLGRARLVARRAGDSASGGAQPKRMALLAYLALAATAEPVRRDALFALFWPERDEEDGRRLLRQSLYNLRRVLGDDVIIGNGDELSLRDGAIECDAVAFERLVADGRFGEALAIYKGDFLDGLQVDDVAPELNEWIARTRSRLRRRASTAAWSASNSAAAAGDAAHTFELARRACELEPDQEAGWRRLMALQEQLGDREGALHTYDDLTARLGRDYDAAPSPETKALADRIRSRPSQATGAGDSATTIPVGSRGTPLGGAERARTRRLRPAVLAGVVGLVVVAGVVAASLRLRDADGSPSLVAAGSLAARDRVVVADFQNLADDSLLTGGITEAFRVDLTQSPLVRVLSARQVASALGRMELSPNTVLTDSLAQKLAVREGAKAIVAGTVAKAGGAFTVSVQLVSAERGDVLAAFRETAGDSTQLLAAVDRASKQLRHRIGESLRSLRALPPLAEETTGSLAALRKYSEAQRLSLAGQRSAAIRLFEEAVAIDTGFASAYVSLGMSYAAIAEPGRSAAARRRAIAHQRRLPFYERSFAVASYAYNQGDYETATDWYTRVLERYPEDIRALNNLALVYRDRRQFAKAESLFARAAMIDSTISNLYFGIHDTQLLQGKFGESRRTLDLIARRFPGNLVLLTVEIQDAAAQQRWEEAERHAETAIAAKRGDTLSLVDPYEALAAIAMTQGRLAEAERYWRTHAMLSAASGSLGRNLYGVMQVARLHQWHRRAPERALALVDSALRAVPLDSMLPADRPYDELARFYASLGRLTRAREMLAAAAANDSVLERTPGADRLWTRGVIALADGRVATAESELRQAAEGTVCTICALPDLARAYDAARKPEAAVVVYERYLATPWFYRYEIDGPELGWAMRRLAELYDARG